MLNYEAKSEGSYVRLGQPIVVSPICSHGSCDFFQGIRRSVRLTVNLKVLFRAVIEGSEAKVVDLLPVMQDGVGRRSSRSVVHDRVQQRHVQLRRIKAAQNEQNRRTKLLQNVALRASKASQPIHDGVAGQKLSQAKLLHDFLVQKPVNLLL